MNLPQGLFFMVEDFPEVHAIWEASQLAGSLLNRYFIDGFAVSTKETQTDFVTSADLAAEDAIKNRISDSFPADSFLGEERGESTQGTFGRRLWVVDPLDGTANFRRRRPNWSTSIAFSKDGVVVLGAISEPLTGRVFIGARGHGAWLVWHGDVCELNPHLKEDLAKSVGVTGFSNDPEVRRRQTLDLGLLAPYVLDLRQYGSAALDFCSVALGTHDFYFERGLKSWDYSAGSLIAGEAGAQVLEQDGTIFCGSKALLEKLVPLSRNISSNRPSS